jgi:hypothetical protein
MPRIDRDRNNHSPARPASRALAALPALAALLLVCSGLAACGGTSKGSSTAKVTIANSSAAGSSTGPTGPVAGRFRALRDCLQKNGITLPKRAPGERPPGAARPFLGGGAGAPRLPSGVTRSQYEAAVKKCGGAALVGAGSPIRSPAFKMALARFAACMRENGVNLPEPNTSGGPIFNSKGLNTASPQFKAAETKCRPDLRGAFRRGPSGGGPPG